MDQQHFSKFLLSGRSNNSPEENLLFLRDAAVLIRGRWGAETQLFEDSEPYLTATFDKYQIGMRRFVEGLGDLQWLLHVQKMQQGLSDQDAMKFILLQQKYNVQPLPTSDPGDTEGSGYHSKTQSSFPIKRKRN